MAAAAGRSDARFARLEVRVSRIERYLDTSK
jgi:hypothetical protein